MLPLFGPDMSTLWPGGPVWHFGWFYVAPDYITLWPRPMIKQVTVKLQCLQCFHECQLLDKQQSHAFRNQETLQNEELGLKVYYHTQ